MQGGRSGVANPSLVLPGGGSLSKVAAGKYPLTSLVPRLLPSFAYAYYTKKGEVPGNGAVRLKPDAREVNYCLDETMKEAHECTMQGKKPA